MKKKKRKNRLEDLYSAQIRCQRVLNNYDAIKKVLRDSEKRENKIAYKVIKETEKIVKKELKKLEKDIKKEEKKLHIND